MSGNTSIAIVPASETPGEINRPLGFDLTFTEMRARVEALNEFYKGVMQQGTDYDVIPGTQKPCLLQPGAQLLDGIFGLAPTFEELPSSIKDWEYGFFHVEMRCRLVSRHTGGVAAEGIGSCNSKEDRYRWRAAKRRCPHCGAEAIIKGKAEYGGGWVCFKKQDGCGAKFRDGDAAIDGQASGRVENEDPYSLVNTISKMAQKRAHLAATLNATGASRIFTQDVEDLPPFADAPVMKPQPTPQEAAAEATVYAAQRRATNGQATPPPTDTASHLAPPEDDEPPSVHTTAAFDADLDAALKAAPLPGAPAPPATVRFPYSGRGLKALYGSAAVEFGWNGQADVERALGGTVSVYAKAQHWDGQPDCLDRVWAELKRKHTDETYTVVGRLSAAASAATE